MVSDQPEQLLQQWTMEDQQIARNQLGWYFFLNRQVPYFKRLDGAGLDPDTDAGLEFVISQAAAGCLLANKALDLYRQGGGDGAEGAGLKECPW